MSQSSRIAVSEICETAICSDSSLPSLSTTLTTCSGENSQKSGSRTPLALAARKEMTASASFHRGSLRRWSLQKFNVSLETGGKLEPLSLISMMKSRLIVGALVSMTIFDQHPCSAWGSFSSAEWTLSGMLLLCTRANCLGSEMTETFFLTLIWQLFLWNSQHSSSLSTVLEICLTFYDKKESQIDKLRQAMVHEQITLLKRCQWDIGVYDFQLANAYRELSRFPVFSFFMKQLASETHRCCLGLQKNVKVYARPIFADDALMIETDNTSHTQSCDMSKLIPDSRHFKQVQQKWDDAITESGSNDCSGLGFEDVIMFRPYCRQESSVSSIPSIPEDSCFRYLHRTLLPERGRQRNVLDHMASSDREDPNIHYLKHTGRKRLASEAFLEKPAKRKAPKLLWSSPSLGMLSTGHRSLLRLFHFFDIRAWLKK